MPQVFNALNGKEMIEVILGMVRKKLEATGEFKESLTFPWSKVSFALGVLAYPQQAKDSKDPAIKVSGEEVVREEETLEEPEGKAKEIKVSGGAVLDTPDKARIENIIPIPTIAPAFEKGPLIDKPIMRVPMKEKGK